MSFLTPAEALHPLAPQLTIACYSKRLYPEHDEDIQATIDKLCGNMPDERKADLYALIEEGTDATMTMGKLCVVISGLLYTNARHFGAQE